MRALRYLGVVLLATPNAVMAALFLATYSLSFVLLWLFLKA